MRPILLVAPLAVWLLVPASAQSPYRSYGAGDVLCSRYTKAARTSDILYHQASNWLLGYVSGMNTALRGTKDAPLVVNLTNDQVLRSAGDYCEANPGRTVAEIANEWYGAIPKQAETAKPAEEKSGSWIINLDKAPDRKPLLDRR